MGVLLPGQPRWVLVALGVLVAGAWLYRWGWLPGNPSRYPVALISPGVDTFLVVLGGGLLTLIGLLGWHGILIPYCLQGVGAYLVLLSTLVLFWILYQPVLVPTLNLHLLIPSVSLLLGVYLVVLGARMARRIREQNLPPGDH